MSDEQTGRREPEAGRQLTAAELEAAERELRARVHRHMGWLATVLVLIAIVVALWRLNTWIQELGWGYSLWEAMGIGATTVPWVLLILGLGVVFSLGTSRLMLGIEKLAELVRRKKAG